MSRSRARTGSTSRSSSTPAELGGLHGRIRFVTETTATLSATRDYSVLEQGSLLSGQTLNVLVRNEPVASRLQVTARPALQLVFEWQPQGDSFSCSMNEFPDLNPGEWFRRTDTFGTMPVDLPRQVADVGQQLLQRPRTARHIGRRLAEQLEELVVGRHEPKAHGGCTIPRAPGRSNRPA